MALSTGGNKSIPLRVGSGPYLPTWMQQDATEEDDRRISVLRQATEAEEDQAGPNVADTLSQPSESASIMRSIDKVGGAKGFSQRVNQLSNYWRAKFGIDPDPTFILDLARVELPLGTIKTGILKSVTNYHRGLATPLQTAEARQWLQANLIPSGNVKGTKARFVLDQDRAAAQMEKEQNAVAKETGLGEEIAGVHFNPYWQLHRTEVDDYQAAKSAAEVSWSSPVADVPSPGQHFLSEVSRPTGLGAALGFDVRRDATQQGFDISVDKVANLRRGGSGAWTPSARKEPDDPSWYGSDSDYNFRMSKAQADTNKLDYRQIDLTSDMVFVKSTDVIALGKNVRDANTLAAAIALAPYAYKGLSAAVGAVNKVVNTMGAAEDWLGWFVHGQFEYMWSGHLTTKEQTSGFHMGRYVQVTGPDGQPAYLTASANMSEEELLKVLDYQGADYKVNSDGTLTVNDPGDSGWWSKLWDGRQAEYGTWLGEKTWEMPFVQTGLRDVGFTGDDESTWGMRDLTAFALQMFYWGLGDVVIGGGVRAGLQAGGIEKLATTVATKTNVVQTLAHVVAGTEDMAKIRAVTGIQDPTVLRKLKGINNVDGVTKELSTVLQEGFALDPTSLMVKNQIKFAVASSDGFNKLPRLMQQAFKVMPERADVLSVHDSRIASTVDAIADAFGSDYATRAKWMNLVLGTTDRHTRIGRLTKMWDELAAAPENTGHYQTALKRMAKYKAVSEGLPKRHLFAPDPEKLIDGKTAVELSIRDTTQQQVRLENRLATAEAQKNLLEQMELEAPTVHPDTMAADELALAQHIVDKSREYIKLRDAELQQWYDDFIAPEAIKSRAKTMRDTDMVREMDLKVLRAFHDLGGLSLRHADIYNPQSTLKENLSLMHGYWSPNNPYSLWREPKFIKGTDLITEASRIKHEFDELVDSFVSGEPELARYMGMDDLSGRKNTDVFFEWLEAHQDLRGGKQPIKAYMDAAETEAHKELRHEMPDYDDQLAQLEEYKAVFQEYDAKIKAHQAAVERGSAYQPFSLPAEAPGILSSSQRQQHLEEIEARIIGIQKEMEELAAQGTANVSVPLHPYQEIQYFHPPVDLDILSTTFAGKVAQALDSLQRGVVVANDSKVARALPGALAGGVAGGVALSASVAADQGDLSKWTSTGVTGFLAMGLGLRGSMKWAARADAAGVKGMTKITPNLDYLTSLWKRYALGSIGVLFRVAGDEPARMASQGYGWDAVMAWFPNSPVQKQMMKDGWYMGPYSYEKGMTQLAYLFNNAYPNTYVAFMPTMDGWEKAFRTSTKIIQAQPTTRVVMKAFEEGEDARVALGRWYKSHPDTAKSMTSSRGTDLESLIDQEVEYLTKFTHRRMKSTGAMGVVVDAKKAEWEAYQSSLRHQGMPASLAEVDLSDPGVYQRIEEPGKQPGKGKPQGLYLSPASVESPHADLGGETFYYRRSPEANILQFVDDGTDIGVAIRTGAKSAGAGVWAARRLLGDEQFAAFKKMGKDKVRAWAKERYPGVDFKRAYDKQDLIEQIGGLEAKNAGYDGIELVDEQFPEFTEFAALTNNAASLITAKKAAPPSWFNPVTDVVLTEGTTGNLVHLRRNSQLYGFLSGKVPLTKDEISRLPMDERPIINARRQKGAIVDADGVTRKSAMGLVDKAYDELYGTFDAVMRNVRTNIYLREYKRESTGLRELALKRGVDVDEDTLHQLCDQTAQRKVDFMTYTSQRTGLENILRDIVPFMPATRDFLSFWAAESVRKPTRFASYLRLNTGLPEEVQVSYDEDTMGGLGRILTHLTAADSFTFNPRALSFFTGGATMSGEGASEDPLWKLMETQFPGFGPMITMPAHYFAANHPDQFGFFPSFYGLENQDLTKIPGMDLVQKSYPLFSRAERLLWTTAATLGSITGGGDPAQGYDFAQAITGGIAWLSRDKEARDRLVDLTLQYVYAQKAGVGMDMSKLTDDEKYALLQEAKAKIVTREGATGFLAFVMPAIPYFHDREQDDIRAAITAYRDTYQDWKQPEEGDERTNWLARSRPDAQRAQSKLRDKYVEYACFFDYIDAMATDDEDKFYEVGAAHPEVVAYFTSIYNNHGDAADYVSLNNYEETGIDGWISARVLGQRPVKNPAALAGEMANVYTRYNQYTDVTKAWADFRNVMTSAGLKEGDAEYEEQKKALTVKFQNETGLASPGSTYRKLGWTTPAELGIGEDPATTAWKKERGALLAAEMQARQADVTTQQGKNAIKAEFVERCQEAGIDPKVLSSGGTTYLPAAERRLNELVSDINRDPFGFTTEDLAAHGIQYDFTFPSAKAKALDLREEVNGLVKQYGGDIWDPKYQSVRDSYFEYVRTLCDTSDSFAQFWDYYQTQDWEKMQDSGRYESDSWQEWFDLLAQRDDAIATAAASGALPSDTCKMNSPSQKLKPIVEQLRQMADDLCARDPAFAQAFKTISWSFWDKVRRW